MCIDKTLQKQFKAVQIDNLGSQRAPEEWQEIPVIKAAKPKGEYVEVSLQLMDETKNIVQWQGAKNGFWYPASPFFLVKKTLPSYYIANIPPP